MPKVGLATLFLFISIIVFSQSDSISYAREITKTLCSPNYHGRGYVKHGCRKAAKYITREFKSNGLVPFENEYTQNFSFPVQTFPGQCSLVLGKKSLVPGADYILHPNSGSTKDYEKKLIWVTYIEILTSSPAQIKEKYGNNDKNAIAVKTNNLSKDTLKIIKKNLEKIANGIMPVLEFTNEKLTWSVGNNPYQFPYLQITYDSIYSNIAEVKIKISSRFYEDYQVQNVIGFIPAKLPSDSIIVISAHYDHLGRMGRKTYFPGANDNASGVAMLLTLSRKVYQNPLDHFNVVFIAFSGEEAGLIGSSYLANNPLFSLEKTRFLFNVDIMGSGEEGITIVNATVHPKEFADLDSINKQSQFVSQIKMRGKAANSDHYPFSEKGVPAFFMYTMGKNKHYHDIYDTSEELSFEAFQNLTLLIDAFIRNF